jgi:hypothetical protein
MDASVKVVSPTGAGVAATVTGTDAAADVAVLQVPREWAPRRSSCAARRTCGVGEPVLAVGSPLGLNALGVSLTAIVEHDLYPTRPDVPLPIATRTRRYYSGWAIGATTAPAASAALA